MTKTTPAFIALFCALTSIALFGQEMKYPPVRAYLMARDAEISLAKSAAPASISDHATIRVLTNSGFEVAQEGDNGFVCFVMRGFTGAPTFTPTQVRMMSYDPKTLAPICLNPPSRENGGAVLRTSNQAGHPRQNTGADRRCRAGRLREA